MKGLKQYLTPLLICAAALVLLSGSSRAAESTKATTVAISLQNIFSMEFYTDPNIVYSTVVPFTNIDPEKSMVLADGRKDNDGKSDTAVVCRSNAGIVWYLKLHLTPAAPLTSDKVKYYIDQPYNRNTGGRADGSLTQTANWYSFSIAPTTIYTSGTQDISNLPFGTLITFNFAIAPSGLEAGKSYSAAITYTLTTTA